MSSNNSSGPGTANPALFINAARLPWFNKGDILVTSEESSSEFVTTKIRGGTL